MLKTLDAFSFEAQPDLDRDAILQVFDCRFVADAANVVFVGGVGTGKTSSTTVGRLLYQLGYRLQSARKRQEGASHPDRNAQFEHINATADSFFAEGQPVISVDTKKKELVGNFKNGGREWQPKGTPPAVLVHDFPTDAEGKAIPYGVYDMARNEAWVSVGRDHDTPAFAVASIRHWWQQMGCDAYPDATPCSSRRMRVGATGIGCAPGSTSFNSWPTRPD